ncbi:MAG TPA: PilX N-terminal domain-containing pilus assembly protein [Burkholderiaceae bacterium]|jgi:type IV pilus assembly protein PilX
MNDFFQSQSGYASINRCIHRHITSQQGASLIVSMILLIVISMLGLSAAQIAIQEEKVSRNDRDRQIAFQAAEAALADAELDIENSPDSKKSRSHIFSKNKTLGFPEDGEEFCQSGENNIYRGLCSHSSDDTKPVWLKANLIDDKSSVSNTVPYGTFTGRSFSVGKGTLPSKLPQYIIELLVYNREGESADQVSYFYRVTAIGFGARDTTSVVLQTFYRKEG